VEIRSLIRRLAKDSTILFSTHILPEVEALCDRVLILINGEIKVDARLSELSSTNDAVLVLDTAVETADAALRELEGVTDVMQVGPSNGHFTYRIIGSENADLTPAIYQLAASHQWPVRELRRDVQTLESVFNKLAV
jgi:ABC-2 type transport system ATP-binding protein